MKVILWTEMKENVPRIAVPSLFLAGGRMNENWRANTINSTWQSGEFFSTTGRLKKKSCFLWLDRDINRVKGKTVNRGANGTKGANFKEVRDNDPVNNCQNTICPSGPALTSGTFVSAALLSLKCFKNYLQNITFKVKEHIPTILLL